MIVRKTLENGLTLLTETMPHVRSVAIGVWVKRGSRHEAVGQAGIAHFIEHMVFKGTKNRSAQTIAAEIDSIGGHMDAFTAKEYAAFHLKVLDEHVPIAAEILGDILLNPLFDRADMGKEKKVIFEEMGMVEDTPDDLVMELLTQSFWTDHPLGRPILGTRKTVGGFDRDDLLSFFRRTYRPENLVIAAAGNIEAGQALDLIRRSFGDLASGRPSNRRGRPPKVSRRVVRRSKKELEQVHVCLATPAFPYTHTDRYVAHVLNNVLGGTMSSRLFQNVREKRGLVYSISSGVSSYSDAGALTIYAGTSLRSLDEVVDLTVLEMKRLKEETVPAAELRRAKDQLKASVMLSLDSSGARMSHLARQEIYFGRQPSLDETLAGIEAVGCDDVGRVAEALFEAPPAASILGNLQGWRPRSAWLRL